MPISENDILRERKSLCLEGYGAPLSFKYNVIKDGIVLLSKDDDKRADFEEKTDKSVLCA